MTLKPVAALLADLGVARSHSRPSVHNDNTYSQAWFKTLKYAPAFPERFGSLADARGVHGSLRGGLQPQPPHAGIGLNTPADVLYGHASTVAEQRSAALAAARDAHPERFTTT
ncbi:hypothetical protein E1J17_00845 [Kocuria rosea]|nr:hypothetical protein E1J17_00845 [Kocuria rosea]